MALFVENHDNPRIVSKVCPEAANDPDLRRIVAKLIATMQLTMRGTPFPVPRVGIREMQLSIKCDNAGLITPIELDEVQNIIENENYNELLESMINKRVELQEQVKRQLEQQEQRKQDFIKTRGVSKATTKRK